MKTATAKRILFVLVAAVLFSAFCPVIAAPAAAEAEAYEDPRFTAVFPSSLRTVGEEAFYGTSIGTAVFQDGLAQIGERAFLNADRLGAAYIPESTAFIGADAFPDPVVIYGIGGSYAQRWAEEYGYAFVVGDFRSLQSAPHFELLPLLLYLIAPADIRLKAKIRRKTETYVKSMRPQDRIELYPINYRFP